MKNSDPVAFDKGLTLPSLRINDALKMKKWVIHKYIPLRYLLVLLKENKLIFNKVTTWEDPYENFFIKERFVLEGELEGSHYVSVENLAIGLYGMSWTLQEETDSLWRIYSPDKLSIRISTTVETMVETVSSARNNWDVWIDKVEYKGQEEIDKWLDDCKTVSTRGEFFDKMGESFFIKRDAFVAEKEFRVIINYYDKSLPRSSFVCFQIEHNRFISSFITDPRLSKDEHEGIKAALVEAGVEEQLVQPSTLYYFKPRKVEMRYDPLQDF